MTEEKQPKHLPPGHSPAFELLLKFAKERGIIKEKETGEGKDARRTTEKELRKFVPTELVREADIRDEASKVAAGLLRSLRERIEAAAYELLGRGVPSEEVERRLKRRFEFP